MDIQRRHMLARAHELSLWSTRRRRLRAGWAVDQSVMTALAHGHHEELHAERLLHELQRDTKASFTAWEKDMRAAVMRTPLSDDWLLQSKGEQPQSTEQWLNLRTGEVQDEHPYERYVTLNRDQQVQKAEADLRARSQSIQDSRESVRSAIAVHVQSLMVNRRRQRSSTASTICHT